MNLNEQIQAKWAPVLEHEKLAPITDAHRRNSTAILLENTERALSESGSVALQQLLSEAPIPANAMRASSSAAADGAIDTFDPVLISLVRRAAPQMIAYDIMGVQPMTGPTGLIFALRSRYSNTANTQDGPEAFYNESNTAWATVRSGANTLGNKSVGTLLNVDAVNSPNTYNFAGGMTTAQAEALGTTGNVDFAEMSFSIEKITVSARSRALAAGYSIELAQDLKAVHGLDVETELSNILTTETLAEINREAVRTVYMTAEIGASGATATTSAGTFNLDVDSNGRWMVEKFKGLMFHIEREANEIAKQTRRGKGNIIVCSSNVASALAMAGVLDYAPKLESNNLQVDDTGNTFAGVLNGRLKVYIDPYATGDFMVVGYKGSSAFDAGIFYCPYVPLQMVRAVDPASFAPRIGFKTRYGMVANPFAQGDVAGAGALTVHTNKYYRKMLVTNIL